MKNKPLNHEYLGGNAVDLTKEIPQRKPNSTMTGEELLRKAVTGTHKQQEKYIWKDIIKKKI